jgi:2-keto-4-pentenoate hydratase/2-oxohepta-3-ene-1,7-dioic acid hydratase in catechol pathway
MATIAHFIRPGSSRPSIGVVLNDSVVDLADLASDAPTQLQDLLHNDASQADELLRAAASSMQLALPLATLTLLPPVSMPGKIICLGLNYADHAAEGGNARPAYPSFFLRTAASLIGHGAPIIQPRVSTQLDFEAELAVIIGKRCRHLTEENALDVVAGYSCFNDGSVRDYQRRSTQWTIGKNFDGTGAFGPFFVQASDLPLGAAGLRIRSRLNGKVMQSSNTGKMLFPVDQTLRLLTEAMTLEVGDVIIMGTPAGVGYARKPPVWMVPGDVVEVEIEGIGTLSNPIARDAEVAEGVKLAENSGAQL